MAGSVIRRRWTAALLSAVSLLADWAGAATLVVGEGGAFQKIQDAIDAASDLDTVQVKAGTYKEAIDFKGKKISVASESGEVATTIDATGITATPVVTFKGKETAESVLDGFTITGGTGFSQTGGVLTGGGIYIDGSAPTIRRSAIVKNTAAKGGGIYIQGAGAGGLIQDCEISENQAAASGPAGGGIHAATAGTSASLLTIADTVIAKNWVTSAVASQGGGCFLGGSNPSAKFLLSGCRIQENAIGGGDTFPPAASQGDGGGLYLDTAQVTIEGGEISGNLALNGGGIALKSQGIRSRIGGTSGDPLLVKGNKALGGGGGFYFPNGFTSQLTISEVVFQENTAAGSGGGGMWIDSGAPVLESCRFIGNSTTQDGGAIRCKVTSAKSKMSAVVFQKNKAVLGGALYVSSASATQVVFTNCLFFKNTASSGGAAVYNKAPSAAAVAKFFYCDFYANAATAGIGGFQFDAAASAAIIGNCILWDNTPSDYPADQPTKISFSDVKLPATFPPTVKGMLSVDPGFVNPDADPPDFHLKSDSPLLDKGDPGSDPDGKLVAEDFDGKPRSVDGNGDGTATPDMGAYELPSGGGFRFVRAEANGDGELDLTDVVNILNYMFLAGETPKCLESADADDTGEVDLGDPVYILNFLFLSGKAIPAPAPGCGTDPTPDTLGCETSNC